MANSDELEVANNPKAAIASALKWAYLAEIVNRLARPLVTIIVARLLLPDDYGVVALASSITSTAALFWSVGLPTALIQRKEDDLDSAANVTFWINGGLAILVFCTLVFSRNYIGQVFREPKVAEILPFMAMPVLLEGFSTVQNAILQKTLAFSRLFWRSTLPSLVPLIVTLPLAWLGFGYWALVWGGIVSSLVGNISLWLTSDWRPSFVFDKVVALELMKFGAPTLGEALQNWTEHQFDRVLIGYFFTVHEVGIYSLGITIYSLIFGSVFSPIRTVGYASLCKVSKNVAEQKRIFLRGHDLISLIVFPLTLGIVVVAPDLEKVVFLGKYPGLAVVLSGLSLYYLLSYAQSLVVPLFRAAGLPQIMLKVNLLTTFLILVFYPLGIFLGMGTFTVFRGLVVLVVYITLTVLILKYFKMEFSALTMPLIIPVITSIIMFLAVNLLFGILPVKEGWLAWIQLAGKVIVGVCMYAALLFLFTRPRFFRSIRFLQSILRKQAA